MKILIGAVLILGLASSISSQKAFLCYWTSWASSLSNSNPSLCSHVSYAFVDVDNNGNLAYSSGMNSFKAIKNTYPNVKLLFSIGGASYNADSAFKFIAGSTSARANFASNILTYIQSNNLNGVDIDWEYPDNQAANFVSLLRDVYNLLNPRGYLVTIAVGVDNSWAPYRYDVANIAQYVHYVNLMTYDYHGSWESSTGINAPLYGSGTIYTVHESTQYWVSRIGSNKNKLLLGIPFYGPSWTLSGSGTGIGAPGSSAGHLKYNQICLNVKNGWTRVFDNAQQGVYAFGNNKWVGYDDAQSIQVKINYINSNGLGGGFIWEMSGDDAFGSCGSGVFPLSTLLKNGLVGGTTTTTKAPATTTKAGATTTTKSSGGTYVCSGPGLFKNPSSCYSFYNCPYAGSSPSPTPCPSGLVFNNNTKNCDWPYNYPC